MNNENLQNEASPVETPVETPVEATAPEATVEAPAAAAPNAAPTAVRAPITDPRKYFLKSNIFRGVTVLLMVVGVLLSLFLPVFTVNTLEDTTLEDYRLYFDAEEAGLDPDATSINFSIMDVISDLGNEFQLCFTLDIEEPEDWEALAEIYENPGKFTLAIDVNMANLRDKEANTAPLADMVSSFHDSRILVFIPYFALLIPVIIIIGFAISTVIRLIQAIIGFIKPSAQIKKTDASTGIVVTIFIGVCYLIHFCYSYFTLNFVSLIVLAIVSIAAIVCNTIYRKYTKEIVDAQFSL